MASISKTELSTESESFLEICLSTNTYASNCSLGIPEKTCFTAQLKNAVEIAEAFGGLYGSEVEGKLAEAFVEHIEFSNEYARAVDDMDKDAKDEANEELDEYLREISVLLSSVIDTVDETTAYTVLRQHEDLLNEAAEQYKNRDYNDAYKTEREALKQIQVVSDVLSQGIVDAMPELF